MVRKKPKRKIRRVRRKAKPRVKRRARKARVRKKGPKHFLSLHDWDTQELNKILTLANKLKRKPIGTALKGKSVVMLFAKPSTRTRVSFEVAINQQGGDDVYVDLKSTQLGRGRESPKDTAQVLSRYANAIVARLFEHSEIEELSQNSDVPVINALTDLLHPCQALADVMTIKQIFKKFKKIKVGYVGDGSSNVCHSLMHASAKFGFDLWVGCPKQYSPNPGIRQQAPKVMIGTDPRGAVHNAHVIYTDSWVSMGQESEAWIKNRILRPYQVNEKLMALARKDAIFMHDLPAHRGSEVTNQVMDSKQSRVYQQAENRLHTEKALLIHLLKKKR